MDCVWFMLTLATFSSFSHQQCPTECQFPSVETSSCAKWQADKDSLVISDPPCFDLLGKYILRECINGTWFPNNRSATCHHLRAEHKCNRGMMQLGSYCATIVGKQTFQSRCPNGTIRYYNIEKLISNSAIWNSIRRINNTFINTAYEKNYGERVNIAWKSFEKDCLVNLGYQQINVDCNESHYQLCAKHTNTSLQKYLPRGTSSHDEVRLELKFDRKREKIILTVYSPEYIMLMLDSNEYAIYCFTDAAINQIKSPLKKKQILSKNNMHVYQIPIHFDHPGQYWCEAVDYQENTIRTKQLVAYRKKRGHEYSLRIILRDVCRKRNIGKCIDYSPDAIIKFLDATKFKDNFYSVNMVVRVMEIMSLINAVDVDVILHLTTLHRANVIGEYFMLKRQLESITSETELIWFRSSEACMPDNMENFTWKVTPLGTKAMPKEICLDARNMPITRRCVGNFLDGAYWGPLATSNCNPNYTITAKTKALYEIISSDDTTNVTEAMKNLTADASDIVPLDVYFIANTMSNLSVEEKIIENVVSTVQNILVANSSILKEAQLALNATDTILDSMEKILQEDSFLQKEDILQQINQGQVFTLIKDDLLIQITKPFLSKINGLAIYDFDGNSSFQLGEVKNLRFNDTFESLALESLDLAFYVPENLLQTLIDRESDTNDSDITLITTVFFNDKLFNSEKDDLGKPSGRVISIKIPDFGIFLEEPIPLLFKNEISNGNQSTKCAFWDYGEDSPNNKTGYWSTIGGYIEPTNASSYSYCEFTHLTHFALLILSETILIPEVDPTVGDVEPAQNIHDIILSAITIIGCTLSLLGLTGIFLTAICFKRWRQKTGTKILLQLSVTITLEIIIVHIADADFLPDKTLACRLVGLCLHYVVVAKFFWMFVSAILQYLRFVQIFTVLPRRLMLKAMLFAWCVPLVPVSLVAGLLPGSYSLGAQRFCYPSGLGLYLGLFMPIACIVIANLIVFTLIMQNVWVTKSGDLRKSRPTDYKLQIYLGILLFFMLGIPWLFGISAEIFHHSPFQLFFVYMFCLTATLQGCVIFVFYVIVDKETRLLWLQAFQQSDFS